MTGKSESNNHTQAAKQLLHSDYMKTPTTSPMLDKAMALMHQDHCIPKVSRTSPIAAWHKLYAVVPVYLKPRASGAKEGSPRLDLAPMNHPAACNWMDACRDRYTDYLLIDWPADAPHPKPPMLATGYRN